MSFRLFILSVGNVIRSFTFFFFLSFSAKERICKSQVKGRKKINSMKFMTVLSSLKVRFLLTRDVRQKKNAS